MVLRIPSKNAKLNAGATGFAAGFQGGIGIGQRQQQIDLDKQSQAFYQDQVLRKAQVADEELQRESSLRSEAGGLAQEITSPDTGDYQGQLQRVGGILKKMGELGAKPDEIVTAAEVFKAKQKEKANDDEKQSLADQVARGTAAGTYFTQQPDGTRTSTPAVDKALQQFSEAAGKKETSPAALRTLKANLDREQIIAKSSFEHVQRQMVDLRGRIDQASQPTTPGPQSANDYAAQSAKTRKLQMMASSYEHLAPQLIADPKEFREFEAKFWPEFSQTEQGIAFMDKDYGPVSFAAADQFMRLKQDNERLKTQAEQTKAALDQAKLQDVPAAAADRAKTADARMMDAQRPRGPASGTGPQRSPSDEELYQQAQKAVLARAGDKKFTDEQLQAETLKEMGRMKSAKRGFESMSGEAPAPGGAPTPEASAASNAGLLTKARAMDPEANKILADKAKAAGWTIEETKAFRDTGKVPAGKKPLE